jgi:hypothetical protein
VFLTDRSLLDLLVVSAPVRRTRGFDKLNRRARQWSPFGSRTFGFDKLNPRVAQDFRSAYGGWFSTSSADGPLGSDVVEVIQREVLTRATW